MGHKTAPKPARKEKKVLCGHKIALKRARKEWARQVLFKNVDFV